METPGNQNSEYLYGINAITTLLEVNSGNRRIYGIYISESRRQDRRIQNIKDLALKKSIMFSVVGSSSFRETHGDPAVTQNIAALVSPYNTSDLDHYLKSNIKHNSGLVMLDQVTDMGNFGSIIRNCRAFGSWGIIIAKKRSAVLNYKVSRISAGALEGITVFRVPNLAMAIRKLKSEGFWIYGTTLDRDKNVMDLAEADFNFPLVLVLGSEDRGMSRIVTDNCDVLLSMALSGDMQSLNVSVASGIILYYIQEKYRKGQS